MIHKILPLLLSVVFHSTLSGAEPAWWAARNVTNASPESNQSFVVTGQFKNVMEAAYDELEAHLPGGAGTLLEDYLYGSALQGDGVLELNNLPNAVVLNGQLKHAGALFLDRLAAEGYFRDDGPGVAKYPWAALPTGSDAFYTPVRIGEVKFLFGFDLTRDSDADGTPDWEELKLMRADGLTSAYFSDFSHGSSYYPELSETSLDNLVAGYDASTDPGELTFERVVELAVNDVARDFNNSRSTPLASFGDYVYWIYAAVDDPEPQPTFHMRLQQINTSGGTTPYPVNTYTFVNDLGQPGHELRVMDGNDTDKGYPDGADLSHSAPSVGVDRDGFIHVTGSMHHTDWEYCVSTYANNVSSFDRIEAPNTRALPYDQISYPRFFNDETGKLYLTFRTKSSNYWFNGTTSAAIASYDEGTRTWELLGAEDYLVGDQLNQNLEPLAQDPVTGLWDLPVHPSWASYQRPDARKSVFYSTEGTYHRFYRVPGTGARTGAHRTPTYGYQAYWQDVKFSLDGRMHVCCAIRRKSDYDPNAPESDPAATVVREVAGSTFWTYDQKTYVMNFDFGTDILYAYSDDGGQTFRTPDGAVVDMPLRSSALDDLNDQPLVPSASQANGGIVVGRDNALDGRLYARTALSLLPDGSPMVQYIVNEVDPSTFNDAGGYALHSVRWDGSAWVPVNPDRWNAGTAGGVVSVAGGGLWAFESSNADATTVPSKPNSNGTKLLYSPNGDAGPWHEVDSAWRNGIRHDSRAASFDGVLRYVNMDIQLGGSAEIVRIDVE